MTDPGGPRDDSDPEGAPEERRDRGHLEDVDVGAGCTEIWEHLAERREE